MLLLLLLLLAVVRDGEGSRKNLISYIMLKLLLASEKTKYSSYRTICLFVPSFVRNVGTQVLYW